MTSRLLIFITIILYALFSFGQVAINKALLLPANGDRVDRQRVEGVETGARGNETVWDMSHASVVEDGCTIRFFNSGDSVVARVERGRQHVYEVKGDSVLLRSRETALTNLADSLPALKMRFPLSYGDSLYSPVYYSGRYSSDNFIAMAGGYTTVVDGEGTLILPDDTVRNVLRVHERLDARVSMSKWSKANVINADNDTLVRHVRDIYSWYSCDFRYPLAQITQEKFYNGSSLTRSDETAFLCTPSAQLYALGDVCQQRQQQAPSTPNTVGVNGYTQNGTLCDQKLADRTNIMAINIADGHVDVTTSANGGINTEVILSDLHGRVFGSSRDRTTHTIDTSQLPHGTYLLYVNDGENVRTERINVK